jgi:biopolymer transport protein ExbB
MMRAPHIWFRGRIAAVLASWLAVLILSVAPGDASAWWQQDFKQRTKVTLNTSAAGIATTEALTGVAVPIRLHSGNFDFLGAKSDGSDLRVLAADDKTPLKFWVERFDSANELALVWVAVPSIAPGTDKNTLYVYAGNDKAVAEPVAAVVDAGAVATFRFSAANGTVSDAAGAVTATRPVGIEPSGLLGASARLMGTAIELPDAARVGAAAGAPYAVSMWIRPDTASGELIAQGPLSMTLNGGRLQVRIGALQVSGGELPPSAWAQVALTMAAGKVVLYVEGAAAGQGESAALPAIGGPLRVGSGYSGLLDELQVATAVRSADWVRFVRAAQGADAKLIASELQRDGEAGGDGGAHGGYLGVLVKNLTVDAWVVIGILGVMFVVALWVMANKTVLVLRTDRGNAGFLQAFRDATDVLATDSAVHANSSLARLYEAGVSQLRRRQIGGEGGPVVSQAALNAVKASIDADLVRENHRLNALMVLLTIAISGGPFLGLLGTVVGVMITFAAIAAAGDVNVNAIAPGIAAALLATVAGLGVAIPALFGYNWLASKIRNISADMQIFVDEFVTRVAERYGER